VSISLVRSIEQSINVVPVAVSLWQGIRQEQYDANHATICFKKPTRGLQTVESKLCPSQVNKVYVYKSPSYELSTTGAAPANTIKETRGSQFQKRHCTRAVATGWWALSRSRPVFGHNPLSCACCAKPFHHSRIETVKEKQKASNKGICRVKVSSLVGSIVV
jgi:hypothetical protein